jgi:hypothetical protein
MPKCAQRRYRPRSSNAPASGDLRLDADRRSSLQLRRSVLVEPGLARVPADGAAPDSVGMRSFLSARDAAAEVELPGQSPGAELLPGLPQHAPQRPRPVRNPIPGSGAWSSEPRCTAREDESCALRSRSPRRGRQIHRAPRLFPWNAELVFYLLVEVAIGIICVAFKSVNAVAFLEVTKWTSAAYLLARGIAKASRVLNAD